MRSDTVARAGELVATATDKATGAAQSLGQRGATLWNGALHDADQRDNVLLGAAALALTAAIGIAAQRRLGDG